MSGKDPVLASLQDELRVTINTLNELYHPVTPAPEERTKLLEARVSDLRSAIKARRDELATSAEAQPEAADA